MKLAREDIFKRIAADDELWNEIVDQARAREEQEVAFEPGRPEDQDYVIVRADDLERFKETPADILAPEHLLTEAIIRQSGRPVLKVRHDDFDAGELKTETWKARLRNCRDNLKTAILSVGRIEVENNPYYQWVGTGWVVAEDVIVTNRHVASMFARRQDGRYVFRRSLLGDMAARLDFREEHQGGGPAEFRLVEVLHIEEDEGPDIALLRIDWSSNQADQQREPIALAAVPPAVEQFVAVIGYPAKDSRTEIPDEMDRIFGNVYNVKRLAPGQILNLSETGDLFTHDSTTLGGCSGSIVCDLQTGQALGLHFGGREEWANYAVSAQVIKERLNSIQVERKYQPVPVVIAEAAPTAESLQDREGYDVDFLAHPVSLPELSTELRQQVAPVAGRDDGLLHYTHFSVMMHAARRMAVYAVCNIDGTQWRHVPRGSEQWHYDPRLERAFQAGNELYESNKLDRGHLVRRIDPAWGDAHEVAKLAAKDTYIYTNCTPQHQLLNQGIWLRLEDHILANLKVHDLKVTVFNGPVFRCTDRPYRGFKIPEDYWKVVVMVREDTGQLSATGYLLSQQDYMDQLEFVFGPYQTYQVALSEVETRTGLGFGDLKLHDPLAPLEARPYRGLETLEDIVV